MVEPKPAAPEPASVSVPQAVMEPEKATEKAPAVFQARFSTTKGDFLLEIHRDWSPNGADRFYNLVKAGYFQDIAFFRAVEGFMVQFGIHGSPAASAKWRGASIADDPAKGISNKRGFLTYAMGGPNTRTTQLFINYRDNANLDSMGFTPFGQVTQGMEVLDSLYKGYGDGPPSGAGPNQGRLQMEGNAFLRREFPNLDYIKSAQLVP